MLHQPFLLNFCLCVLYHISNVNRVKREPETNLHQSTNNSLLGKSTQIKCLICIIANDKAKYELLLYKHTYIYIQHSKPNRESNRQFYIFHKFIFNPSLVECRHAYLNLNNKHHTHDYDMSLCSIL